MANHVILRPSGFHHDDESNLYYTEGQLFETFGKQEVEADWKTTAKKVVKKRCACSGQRLRKFFYSLFPILQWLQKYKPREYLIGDVAAGLTVGIVHLPQGMAYGLLASLPPVTGLYVSFFPVLVYVFLGTSRHISIGTFAVVSLMIAQVVDNHVTPCPESDVDETYAVSSTVSNLISTSATNYTGSPTTVPVGSECEKASNKRKMEIAVALAMANGLIHVAMSMLRLGIVTTYLSDHLVSGFTCAAAFHVMTSQVSKLLGLTVPRHSGPLALIYTYVDIFKNITSINWATFIVSACCILFLVAGKEVNARFKDRLPIPLPWELVVVIFGTISSYFGHFYSNYKVQIVGEIPTGIETSVPKANDIGLVMLDAIPIAVVTFAIEISLCQMFAGKHSYKVDSDQELFALGIGNIIGSFFSCFPSSASLSRSAIWEEVGAWTQLTGFFSSVFILIVMLWIGPLFESLPQAALACIIVVNLKGLLRQFEKLPPLWALSKLDALTWIVTWLAVILLGVSLGLAVGVAFELFTIVIKTQIIKGSILGPVGLSRDFRDVTKYHTDPQADHNVIIFRFPGPIIFANKERFKSQICRCLGFDPSLASNSARPAQGETDDLVEDGTPSRNYFSTSTMDLRANDKEPHLSPHSPSGGSHSPLTDINLPSCAQMDEGQLRQNAGEEIINSKTSAASHALVIRSLSSDEKNITHFLLDMSCCPFIDNDGSKTIKEMHKSLLRLGMKLFLTSCNDDVRRILTLKCDETRPPFFTSIVRALEVASGETGIKIDDVGNALLPDQSTFDTRL